MNKLYARLLSISLMIFWMSGCSCSNQANSHIINGYNNSIPLSAEKTGGRKYQALEWSHEIQLEGKTVILNAGTNDNSPATITLQYPLDPIPLILWKYSDYSQIVDIRISGDRKVLYYKIKRVFPNIFGAGENKSIIYAFDLSNKKKMGESISDLDN